MTAESHSPALAYERLVFHRRLLVWTHVVLALIVALIFLNSIDFSHFAYWRRGFGVVLSFVLVPPLLPYLISGIYSGNRVTQDRIRLAAFLLVLVLGSAVMGASLLGAFGSVGRITVLVLFGAQTIIYVVTAELLLHVE
jgi:hypothetical protein